MCIRDSSYSVPYSPRDTFPVTEATLLRRIPPQKSGPYKAYRCLLYTSIPLIHPVRNNSSHREQYDHRDKCARRNRPKQSRIPGLIQQIKWKRIPQNLIAKQRYNLADNHEQKIFRKTSVTFHLLQLLYLLLFPWTHLFHLHFVSLSTIFKKGNFSITAQCKKKEGPSH